MAAGASAWATMVCATVSETVGGRTIGPGTELDGFVIEAVAGRGGMGVVYRARQRRPDRIVALKVIAVGLAGDPAFRARFQRESSIAAQIEHPNVIPVHAVGESDGVLYIAMRFVDGTDMRSLIAQEGRLEPRRAATIVDQVAQALDAAHRGGLVHRDVKPANILISTSGGREHVYLTDFGLSRHIEGSQALTGTGAFLGTIDYVAPEQARGERVDARTDVYSLGCVLFQALTGTVPYPMDNELAKLYAHDAQPPPSAIERAPDVPVAFETVLGRAMAKDPDDRYLSAGDLGRAALGAASGALLSRAERSVAVGPAAPAGAQRVAAAPAAPGPTAPAPTRPASGPTVLAGPPPPLQPAQPTRPTPPLGPRRRRILAGALTIAAVVVTGIVVLIAGGGSSPTAGNRVGATLSKLVVVEVKNVTAPRGYTYRLALLKEQVPASASPTTPVPYHLMLMVRRFSAPFHPVQRLRLPFRFTASSVIADFALTPNPNGSANVGLSWAVKRGDTKNVTHYFTLTLQAIKIDS